MPINLQQVINSRIAVRLISSLGWIIPPAIGYPLCDLLVAWIATRRGSNLVRAVRLNQWVARGANLKKEALDRAVWETLRTNAYTLYELYHYIERPAAAAALICLNSMARGLVERPEFGDRGFVIVGLHLSSFDLILQSLSQQGLKLMVLTIPEPQGGRRMEFERRQKIGMNLVPASVSALRQAVKHLELGGVVLTGIDRPIPDAKYHPRFFGHAAPLPIHHVYLASKARVPVVIMAAIQQSDGRYHVMNSEPIEMERNPDHMKENLRNAESVLRRAEDFIRLAPQQWNMPLPVWPDLLYKVPV